MSALWKSKTASDTHNPITEYHGQPRKRLCTSVYFRVLPWYGCLVGAISVKALGLRWPLGISIPLPYRAASPFSLPALSCLFVWTVWIGLFVGCGSNKGLESRGACAGVPMGISLTFPQRVRKIVARVEALLETEEDRVRVVLAVSDTTAAMVWCAPIGTIHLTLRVYDTNGDVRYVGRRLYQVRSGLNRIQADFFLYVADVTFRLAFPMEERLETYRTETQGRFDVVDDKQRLTLGSIVGCLERKEEGAYLKTLFVRDVPAGGRSFSAYFYGEGDVLLYRGGCAVQIPKDSEVEVPIEMEAVHRGRAMSYTSEAEQLRKVAREA